MPSCPRCGAEVVPPNRFCSACGQPLGAAPGAPFPSYPPPKKDSASLIIVLVVILLVGLPTLLAGVLYYVATGLSVPGAVKPAVTLTVFGGGSSGATVLVESIQPMTATANVRVNLQVDGISGSPMAVPSPNTATSIVVGSGVYAVGWYNPSVSGELSQGDQFVITFPFGYGAPAPGATITFLLLWKDGSTLASVAFRTPSTPPTVLLNVTKLASGADVVVFYMDPLYPPTGFRVNVENVTGSVYGNATPMPAISGSSVYVTVGAGTSGTVFWITWQNPSGTGEVSGGDHFVVTWSSGAYATGTAFEFVLAWTDGSTLATAAWTV